MEHIIQTVSQEGGIGNILMGAAFLGGFPGFFAVFGSFLGVFRGFGDFGGFPDAPYPLPLD